MNIYCTLFDSNYLDKGLVLYQSLCGCEDAFRLYVFAFDDHCRKILEQEAPEHMIVVPLEQFETDALRAVKNERSRAEYCWTCTPWIIRHVLDQFQEPMCTYIDADMMFFSSPQYIFDDMRRKNCSTLIVPHRFLSSRKARAMEAHVGTYCVEFNTFFNDHNGWAALDWWAERCLTWCYYTSSSTDVGYGDQKYLNEFESRFQGVYVCEEHGAGLAPWNVGRYRLAEGTGDDRIINCETGKVYPIVFFHFATIMQLTKHYVNVYSNIKDPALHRVLYDRYMEQIVRVRSYLREKYGLDFYLRRKISKNIFLSVYQQFLSPLMHLRSLSDIYRI